jgi:multidrug efflux pump subunit AcrA (membrane-fusion protein)
MDDDEMIDGSAAQRRFAEDRSASPSAARAASATMPALSDSQSGSATIGVRLFDPNRFLGVVAVLFWPLKFFPILLIPAVLLAGLTMYKHWNDIAADLHQLLGEFSFIVHLLLSLLIINLGVRLAMGAVVRAFGAPVRDFGLIFFLGMVPRFYVDRSAIPRLDRSGQLWAYGAPLLVRLGFFAFGMLAWATYRSNETWISSLALLVSQAGLWSFLFAIMPFMPGDGYNWLAVYFRQPILRQKAFMALNAKLRGRQLPPGMRGQTSMLIVFAVGIILAIVAFGLATLTIAAVLLTRQMQGLGAVIFLALVAGFVIWILSFRAMRPQRKQQQVRLLRSAMAGQADAAEAESAPTPARRTRHWLIWAGVAAALITVAFLPSSYDPAGPFEILPVHSSKVIARTNGTVVDVLIREGDSVRAGQVLARLSSGDQQRDLDLTRAELDGAVAQLAALKDNASNAGVREAAQSEVERLRRQFDTDQTELERTVIRAPVAGFIAKPNPQFLNGVWLNAGDDFLQIDDAKVVEAEIGIAEDDIALVQPGAQVRLRPWSEGNREIVGRVTAIAPTAWNKPDNKVIGGHDALRNAGVLPRSARIADEADDLDNTEPSNIVRVNASSANADPSEGRPSMRRKSRATEADKSDNSNVVRVKASVANADASLRPAMTGYAKISGPSMRVWEAYRRLCVRFFTVELWAWVP